MKIYRRILVSMHDFFKKFFKQFDEAPKTGEKKRDYSFPDFLEINPHVYQRSFQPTRQYEKGSATIVFPFEKITERETIALGYKYEDFIVKRYDPSSDLMDKLLFGDGHKKLTLHEKCVILKARHKRIENFFSEIPDLVSPSEYLLSGKSIEDAKIYEVQERLYGCVHDLSSDDFHSYIEYLAVDKKKKLELTLTKIIERIENGIENKEKVPDINFSNFMFTYDGDVKYIDTNVEFDWNKIQQDLEKYANYRDHQLRAIEKLKFFLKRLNQF